MKFMLLIGGNRDEWAGLSETDWSESEKAHADLISELKLTGEFIECNELNVSAAGSRVVRTENGAIHSVDGPLHDSGDFASGYYLLIEVRQVGG